MDDDDVEMLPPPQVSVSVGWRVFIWWPRDAAFYLGVVAAVSPKARHILVHYDDDDKEWIDVTRQVCFFSSD
jgi:hypothetical protein